MVEQNRQDFITATDAMGGPAYPFVVGRETNPVTGAIEACDVFPGMSLRDWFAGQALMGMMASRSPSAPRFEPKDDADFVYQIAAAMIAARKAGA